MRRLSLLLCAPRQIRGADGTPEMHFPSSLRFLHEHLISDEPIRERCKCVHSPTRPYTLIFRKKEIHQDLSGFSPSFLQVMFSILRSKFSSSDEKLAEFDKQLTNLVSNLKSNRTEMEATRPHKRPMAFDRMLAPLHRWIWSDVNRRV